MKSVLENRFKVIHQQVVPPEITPNMSIFCQSLYSLLTEILTIHEDMNMESEEQASL